MSSIISISESGRESLESLRSSDRQLLLYWNSVNAIGKFQLLFDNFRMVNDSIDERGTIMETNIQWISHHQFIPTFTNTLTEHPSVNVIDSFEYIYEVCELKITHVIAHLFHNMSDVLFDYGSIRLIDISRKVPKKYTSSVQFFLSRERILRFITIFSHLFPNDTHYQKKTVSNQCNCINYSIICIHLVPQCQMNATFIQIIWYLT